ncbi:MAG TPA: very short patch repair endonuclease [Pyrinomonadaceae bacterium]|nr:very short patch repair endonuclease [Pyrinomonadaceae bacterium]
MADHISPEQRSRNMSRVKGRDTRPEMLVRSIVHRLGYRFRLHGKKLPGRPDVVLTRHRKVIFVHGCFWHGHPGCRRAARPSTNREFWDKKIDGNMARDSANIKALRREGWAVLVVWQCAMKDRERLEEKLSEFLAV